MFDRIVTLYVPNPQSGQTHSNNSSAVATRFAELFECVDHFAGLAFKGLNASLLPSNYPFSRTMYKATVNSVKSSIGFIKGNAK